MNRARKTSSCGCFRSAFCLLKPSTSTSSSEDHGDSDKKLLQMNNTGRDEEEEEMIQTGQIKVPPLNLNGVEKKNWKSRGMRRRTSDGGRGGIKGSHLAEVVCEFGVDTVTQGTSTVQ
uniref:Uncharacterized protein n=1 Tax=Caenorhabditis tropicalis TaxID=1561998 RepID=A0A1I7UNW4_9PELO